MTSRPALWLRLLCLLAALCASAGAGRAQDWDWAEGRTVLNVEWQGLEAIHPTEAASLISTAPGEIFSAAVLAEDLGRLYRSGRFGSPGSGVAPVAVDVRQQGQGVIVTFQVHERRNVRRVVFEGADLLDEDELAPLVTTRAGSLYDDFAVQRDAVAVRQKLRTMGYLYAEVTHREEARESGVDVFFAVRAGPKVYVDDIVFEGARQLDPEDLYDMSGPDALEVKERQVFGLLESGVYDPLAFDRDLDKITRWYRSKGFLDARLYKQEERFDLEGRGLTLVVGVEEGPRYRVRRVGIEGTRVISEERLMRDLPLRPGSPFVGDDLRDSVERIRNAYGQQAYIHASVDVDVAYDRERHLLDVTLNVNEGPKVRLEEVRIEGNDKTQQEVIRRELSFYPGEYFNSDEIQASLARLGRLRYFNDVRLDFLPGSEPGSEHLVLRVEEARTGSFVIGGGVSTSAGFFGNISLTQRNFDLLDPPTSLRDFIEGRAFTGAGQTLSISLQPGRERSQFSVEFTEPWLLGFPVILGLEGYLRDRVREDWLESRRAGRFSLGYRLTPDLLFRTTYRIERVRVADIEQDALADVVTVAGNSYVGTLRASLDFDQNLIDRYFVAYGGYALGVAYEVAGKELASDYAFHRVSANANWQTSLLEFPGDYKWVLGFRAEMGWQRPFGKEPVPIFERFFAGGPNSLRGFEFRTVVPQERDKPKGGDWLALGTIELSFPIFKDIVRGVVFSDMGGVTAEIADWRREDFRVAAGFGFRIRIPIFPAPVALDFAWPLRKRDEDDPQVFSFSVGFGF